MFVHGIRGGPFASWVHLETPAARRRRLSHDNCWPSAWLAADVPSARLLSLQYAGKSPHFLVFLFFPSELARGVLRRCCGDEGQLLGL